ncbi:hypothetical protein [Sphingomonas oryzagri]
MQILATRKRVAGTLPLYEYRILVPIDHLLRNRAALISERCNDPISGGPHARLHDVIAPIDWLRMKPGLDRDEKGRDIARIAEHIEAVLIAALYPEVTVNPVPALFSAPDDPGDSTIITAMNEIADGYRFLYRRALPTITAEGFGLRLPEPGTPA